MPIIKSAKKRVRQTNRANDRNTISRTNLRSAVKKLQTSLTSKKNAAENYAAAQSSIDQAVKKGLMHKNKAARKKSQLSAAAKAAGIKVNQKAAPKAKPAPAKKAVAKKVSKPATKKAAAKKSTKK